MRPYFERNGTSTRFDWISCRRRRFRRGLFFGHVGLFSRYGRFFVRFLSRFSSRHPSVLVLRTNRGDGEPRAHASKVERCGSLKDRSDGLFAHSLRCVVWRQYYILVFLLVEWRINSEVSFICLLLTGDCSRNSKSYRWHLESRQGFENRGMSNALKVERPHLRSE